MATSAERQRAYRERLREQNSETVTVIVYKHQVAGLKALAAFLKANPGLVADAAMVRELASGRMRKVK